MTIARLQWCREKRIGLGARGTRRCWRERTTGVKWSGGVLMSDAWAPDRVRICVRLSVPLTLPILYPVISCRSCLEVHHRRHREYRQSMTACASAWCDEMASEDDDLITAIALLESNQSSGFALLTLLLDTPGNVRF